MSGAELAEAKINVGEKVDPAARVVVIHFAGIEAGESIRMRIAETYTAPASYRLEGEDLVFERSLGRPRNAVVLPSGWYCTFSAAPATVSQTPGWKGAAGRLEWPAGARACAAQGKTPRRR